MGRDEAIDLAVHGENLVTVCNRCKTGTGLCLAAAAATVRLVGLGALDEPDVVAERIGDDRDLQIDTDRVRQLDRRRADRGQVLPRGVDVLDAPVADHAAATGRALRDVRIEAELVTIDLEADVVRLVEVRILAERLAVELLGE